MPNRVLVVEDEFLVATMIEECLLGLGYEVAGIKPSLADALAAVDENGFDLAMLDMNLAGTSSTPVAEALAERGIPFMFMTGYGAAGVPDEFHDRQIMQKPFRLSDLQVALKKTAGAP